MDTVALASWTFNMQDVMKLVRMSTGIDPEKATSLEKSQPPHELCESRMVGKQHRAPSRVVNQRILSNAQPKRVSYLTVT